MPTNTAVRQPVRPETRARVHRAEHSTVVATRPIAEGETVLLFEGEIAETPSRYSLQIGERAHLTPANNDPSPHVWPFLNHSCQPNTTVDGTTLVAIRDIGAGDFITFDYNSSEFEIAEPFVCVCGTCGGRTIRGYAHLSATQRRELNARLPRSLMARLYPSGIV